MDPGNKIPQAASAAITAAITQSPPRKRAQRGHGLLLQKFGNRLLAQCISTTSISPNTLQSDYVRDWISHITDGKYQLPCKDEITTIIDDLYSECLQHVLICKSPACVK